MFSLDYQTFSQTLQRMRYTGSVTAAIPSGAFARGQVFLEVRKGVIQTCIVTRVNGQQIDDHQQIGIQLSQCGLLEWHLSPATKGASTVEKKQTTASLSFSVFDEKASQSSFPTSSNPADFVSINYPQRLPADPAWMSTWSRFHRQVYNLCTGQYSEQDIARLLRYPLEDLQSVLSELEHAGVLLRGI